MTHSKEKSSSEKKDKSEEYFHLVLTVQVYFSIEVRCQLSPMKIYLTMSWSKLSISSEAVKYELEHNKSLVRRLLSDVSYQSADNLVDGLTKYQEEAYNYKHYYGTDQHLLYNADYQ